MIDIDKLEIFDASKFLETDEDIAVFLDEAFNSNDIKHIAHALGIVAKAKGMTEIAKKSGIRREQLYRALSGDRDPRGQTLLDITRALGFRINITPTQTASETPEPRATV